MFKASWVKIEMCELKFNNINNIFLLNQQQLSLRTFITSLASQQWSIHQLTCWWPTPLTWANFFFRQFFDSNNVWKFSEYKSGLSKIWGTQMSTRSQLQWLPFWDIEIVLKHQSLSHRFINSVVGNARKTKSNSCLTCRHTLFGEKHSLPLPNPSILYYFYIILTKFIVRTWILIHTVKKKKHTVVSQQLLICSLECWSTSWPLLQWIHCFSKLHETFFSFLSR